MKTAGTVLAAQHAYINRNHLLGHQTIISFNLLLVNLERKIRLSAKYLALSPPPYHSESFVNNSSEHHREFLFPSEDLEHFLSVLASSMSAMSISTGRSFLYLLVCGEGMIG